MRTIIALTVGLCVLASASCAPEHLTTAPKVERPTMVEASADEVIEPGDDAAAIVESSPEGTTFLIKAGKHYGFSVQPRDGHVFTGEDGAVVSGATLVTEFRQEGGLWVLEGRAEEGEVRGICYDDQPSCAYPEQVFLDGEAQYQVLSLAEVEPGTFYFDYAADEVYLGSDPTGKLIEVSGEAHAFTGPASNVVIQNLVVEQYANNAQEGAINARDGRTGPLSRGWVIRNSTIQWNSGEGIKLGHETLVEGSLITHNGRLGIHGSSDFENAVVQDNEVAWNCMDYGFECLGWGGGGIKVAQAAGITVRDNFVHHNDGKGLHADVGSGGVVFERNVVEDNEAHGIIIEISCGAVISRNQVRRNGHGEAAGALAGGISILSSSGVEITRNVVEHNAFGVWGRQDEREWEDCGKLGDLTVTHNLIRMTEGFTGVAANAGSSVFSSDIVFDYNTYQVFEASDPFRWENGRYSIEEWRSLGFDANSFWMIG